MSRTAAGSCTSPRIPAICSLGPHDHVGTGRGSTAEVVALRPDEVVFGRPVGQSFADPHLRLALDVDEHLRVQVTGSTETSVARRRRQVTVDAAAPHGLAVRFVAQPTTA